MSFKTKIQNTQENIVVELSGDLDIESSEEMKNEILEVYDEKRKNILVDLEKLDYLDSMGIGALISVYNTLKENGNVIKIINAQKNIYKLFKITDLLDIFNMEEE